jgi:hypothetical protein
MKKRFVWTPNELSERAEACYEAVFGESVEVKKDADNRPVPALLPKPVRPTPGPKGKSISVSELRKAQRAERRRRKFNRKVAKSVTQMKKALLKALETQAQSAIKVEKACNAGHRAQAEAAKAKAKAQAKAALAMMRKARKAVEDLRKRIQAAQTWLSAERHRQRRLDQESRVRIAKAIAWGIIPDWHGDFED